MVIQPLSTRLIKPNFHVSLSNRRSTTVSLETRNLFPNILRAFSSHKTPKFYFLSFSFWSTIRWGFEFPKMITFKNNTITGHILMSDSSRCRFSSFVRAWWNKYVIGLVTEALLPLIYDCFLIWTLLCPVHLFASHWTRTDFEYTIFSPWKMRQKYTVTTISTMTEVSVTCLSNKSPLRWKKVSAFLLFPV